MQKVILQQHAGVDIAFVSHGRNVKDNWVSPQWLWVFCINILTVVFMKASPRQSDPTERNCPTGGTVNGSRERKLKLVQHEEVWMEYQTCVRHNSEAPATGTIIPFFVRGAYGYTMRAEVKSSYTETFDIFIVEVQYPVNTEDVWMCFPLGITIKPMNLFETYKDIRFLLGPRVTQKQS